MQVGIRICTHKQVRFALRPSLSVDRQLRGVRQSQVLLAVSYLYGPCLRFPRLASDPFRGAVCQGVPSPALPEVEDRCVL